METIGRTVTKGMREYVEVLELLSSTIENLCKISKNQNTRINALEKKIKELEAAVKRLKGVSE